MVVIVNYNNLTSYMKDNCKGFATGKGDGFEMTFKGTGTIEKGVPDGLGICTPVV